MMDKPRRDASRVVLWGAGIGAAVGYVAWLATRRPVSVKPTSGGSSLPPDEPENFPPPPPPLAPGERPKPDGVVRQMSIPERDEILTRFSFVHAPTASKDDAIRITDDWIEKNIVTVCIPQLAGVQGAPKNGCVEVHRLAAPRLKRLFRAWEVAGLLPLVKTWHTLWDLRFARGGILPRKPSTHAYGAAFDINIAWNPYGEIGPSAGKEGSVYELVRIAAREGWYWGGWFGTPDDMHFEFGVPLKPASNV